MSERPIIGKKYEPLRLKVQTSDRKEPGQSPWEEIRNDRSPSGIGERGEDTGRLVQEKVKQVFGRCDPLAIARYLIHPREDLCPKPQDSATIDANSPLED